jgi:hypothetical protein
VRETGRYGRKDARRNSCDPAITSDGSAADIASENVVPYVGDEQANVSPTATAGCDGSHRHGKISIAREPITKAVPDRFDEAERDGVTMITRPSEMDDDEERVR